VSIIINPHSAYVASASEPLAKCEIGCVEKFIPKHLNDNPLFEKISYLMCYYENAWTDAEIRQYLSSAKEFYRTRLGNSQVLNWFSLISWIEAQPNNWSDSFYNNGFGDIGSAGSSQDFYQKYSLSTKDIWLSFSSVNQSPFNEDGFNYYGYFIEPYIGTNLIQRKLLEKLELDNGEVIDWYNAQGIINSYSFQLEEFPGWDKTKILIIGSRLLKNAESILLSVKDKNCPNRFILSHSFLDMDYLSDITALQFEGVTICFQRYREDGIPSVDLFKINKLYTKIHYELINYFIIRRLSVDLILDELLENKIFRTHTPNRKGKFVQLLPAWIPFNNTWSHAVTWEDHYDWQSIIVTNLIRKVIEKEREPLYWTTQDIWGRWIGWEGDPAEWIYNKPPLNRNDYYENSNFIAGFEPESGKSLFKPLVFSNKVREFLYWLDVDNPNQEIIRYWTEDFSLSETLFQDEPRSKTVYSNKIRWTPTNNYNQEIIRYWTEDFSLSETLFQDEPRSKTVYSNKIREVTITNYNQEIIRYWTEDFSLSETLFQDEPRSKTVFIKHTQEIV